MNTHWYLVFQFSKGAQTGTTYATMTSEKPWLPLEAAHKELLRANGGYDAVVVTNWAEISEEQYKELRS
jgi:hypothetical protein